MSALAKRLDAGLDADPKQSEERPAHLWKPGQSGNPGGKPKRAAYLRALSNETFPVAIERLKQLINSKDEELAFRAVQFCYLYVLGKPAELHQLAHIDAMMAKTAELLIEHPPQEQLPTAVTHDAGKEVVPERTAAVPEHAGESVEPPASVTPVLDVQPEVKGLRCIYRGESGQCEAQAAAGVNWCEPHRAKLFEALK